MEKRRLTGKDILRMDGLLPPTRRLPVCNAVSTTASRKKEKKWSIGGILKRISSIRDGDSSSNEEEMVYCKREPKKRINITRKSNGITLRPVCKDAEKRIDPPDTSQASENNVHNSGDLHNLYQDSIHSRSSDGSLDGLGKKTRRNKVKARVEAKRVRLCAESSSEEDSRKSSNSLTRSLNDECPHGGQKNVCNRKTRAARTERYIKRLSKDEGNGYGENICPINNKRCTSDWVKKEQYGVINGQYRPPIHPRQFHNSSPTQKTSTDCLRSLDLGIPVPESRVIGNRSRYSSCEYITDLNQNNAFGKYSSKPFQQSENPFSTYSECSKSYNIPTRQLENRMTSPPTPPPRDPRCRSVYTYHSFPLNGKFQRSAKHDTCDVSRNESGKCSEWNAIKSYGSNNEITWCGTVVQPPRRPMSLNSDLTRVCDSQEYINNRYNLMAYGEEPVPITWSSQENVKQSDLVRNKTSNSVIYKGGNVIANRKGTVSDKYLSLDHKRARTCENIPSTSNQRTKVVVSSENLSEFSSANIFNKPYKMDKQREAETKRLLEEEAAQERKRNSKNLEEALSELEAIYNSLRLGDEELLDRAERRSMEEFSLRQGKNDSDVIASETPDSPDRTKDDMAYRRMNPKERPTSLSDAIGQSSLSNISYLIASPILLRKDVDDCASTYSSRRNEPDVTRDDVVFRSMSHANKTLKVLDPQPPFGIPLGPVATAMESDYLHTTPRKPEHPRSSYIPQSEPDIVTDDLAFRSLRKDASTTRSLSEARSDDGWLSVANSARKKRAIRSLSANLYGLINQDKIHLHKHPNGQTMNSDAKQYITGSTEFLRYREHPMRVMSDGELSDRDHRWCPIERPKIGTDINGNHATSECYQRKLRVYISPIATVQTSDDDREKDTNASASISSGGSLPRKTLEDEFCHIQSDSNISTSSRKSIESDFSAYTRLCQDLVDLIKVPDDATVKPDGGDCREETKNSSVIPVPNIVNDSETDAKQSTAVRTKFLEEHFETYNRKSADSLTDTLFNLELESQHKTEENDNLDYYLRLADENVKLIAEAFSSVADHICDSNVVKKNHSLFSTPPELDHRNVQETSSRSSAIYDDQEEEKEEEIEDHLQPAASETEASQMVNSPCALIIVERDQSIPDLDDTETDNSNVNSEDLSKAVNDLEVASAILRENIKMDDCELKLSFSNPMDDLRENIKDECELKSRFSNPIDDLRGNIKDECELKSRFSNPMNDLRENIQRDECEFKSRFSNPTDDGSTDTVTGTESTTSATDKDVGLSECGDHEKERDQEETVVSSGLEEQGDECKAVCEGLQVHARS